MTTPNQNGFILLISSDEWYNQLGPGELEKIKDEAKAWVDQLASQGKVKGGVALERQGVRITGSEPTLIVDGPFIESKEAIGGTLVLDVPTLEEAIAIARTSPTLRYNTSIEVRPIADECPLEARSRRLRHESLVAQA